MRVLAVETSGRVGSVALQDGDVVHEVRLEERGRHGDLLGPTTRRLLADAGCDRAALDVVAVGIGPGSYTGVRIGVTFAKTLARMLDRPLVGLCGLMALAEDAREAGPVVAVMEPGHATRVYGAVYELSGPVPAARSGPELLAPAELVRGLPPGTPVIGNAVPRHASEITSAGARPVVPDAPLRVRASTLATMARRWLVAGNPPAEPATLEPLYLQASAPERG